MPHIPDLRTHATHDLELVAAYAAGDAAGADLETATALVSGCAECAALHHDLRAIAAALPDLPAPARPRDFRLTPEQAASLRPAGWRRLLGALAGPRFRLATPLGTGLATLGLAGLLVGTLAGIPLGSGAASAPGPREPADASMNLSLASEAPVAPPSAAPSVEGVPAGTAEGAFPVAGGGVDTAGDGSEEGYAAASPDAITDIDGTEPQGVTGEKSAGDVGQAPGGRSAAEVLVLAGGVAVLVGVALVGLRWSSRRLG